MELQNDTITTVDFIEAAAMGRFVCLKEQSACCCPVRKTVQLTWKAWMVGC